MKEFFLKLEICIAVLRGYPVVYRITVDKGTLLLPRNFILAECAFICSPGDGVRYVGA